MRFYGILFVLLVCASELHAQNELSKGLLAQAKAADEQLVVKSPLAKEEREMGWMSDLKLGANISYGTSSNVVGQVNGESVTYGGKLNYSRNYLDGLNDWRNRLDYTGSTAKTPAVPRFVKSNDQLNFNSLYQRSFETNNWIGAYAQFDLKTPMFRGEDVRMNNVTYVNKATGETRNESTLKLTNGFNPLKFKESLGSFFKLHKSETTLVEARLGYGALQVVTNGFVLADDAATPTIEYTPVYGYSYSGAEIGFNLETAIDQKTKFTARGEMLIPVGYKLSGNDTRNAFEIADIDVKAVLSTQISELMSFNYEVKAVKQPLLTELFQVQSLGTINFNVDVL